MEKKLFPGSNVYVSECGRVFKEDGTEVLPSFNRGGYKQVSVRWNGKSQTVRVNRMVLMTWDPDPNQDILFGNHFDFDVTNNHRNNLDWVNNKWNNIHSMIFSGRIKRPVVKCIKGDEEFLIQDAKQLDKLVGVPLRDIWLAIKKDEEINGWKVSPILYDDLVVIREIMNTVKREKPETGIQRKIKVLDTDTNEWKEYPSMRNMSEQFGVFITHIRHRLSTKENPRIFANRYVIHDLDTDVSYLTPELITEMRTRGSKPTLALIVKTGEFLELANSRILTKKYGLSKSKVSKLLKSGKIKLLNGFLFTYINGDIDKAKERLEEAARLLV